jgi:hypothetical protein
MYNSRCACARHTVVFGASMGSSRIANSCDPRVGIVVDLALMSRQEAKCSVLVGFRGGRRGCRLTAHWAPVPAQRRGMDSSLVAMRGQFNLDRNNARATAMVCGGISQEVRWLLNRKINEGHRLPGGAGLLMIGGKLRWQGIELSLVPFGKYT